MLWKRPKNNKSTMLMYHVNIKNLFPKLNSWRRSQSHILNRSQNRWLCHERLSVQLELTFITLVWKSVFENISCWASLLFSFFSLFSTTVLKLTVCWFEEEGDFFRMDFGPNDLAISAGERMLSEGFWKGIIKVINQRV